MSSPTGSPTGSGCRGADVVGVGPVPVRSHTTGSARRRSVTARRGSPRQPSVVLGGGRCDLRRRRSAATRPRSIALFDHEEVGSESTTGAAGRCSSTCSSGCRWRRVRSRADFLSAAGDQHCVSADNAHAVHPNYRERHDPDHQPIVNRGPAIKLNSNQRYATSARSAAMLQRVFDEAGVPSQVFVSRNNMPCGSTIGPITATRLGIETVDVGVPQLSMHSARELCGVDDPISLAIGLAALLRRAASDRQPTRPGRRRTAAATRRAGRRSAAGRHRAAPWGSRRSSSTGSACRPRRAACCGRMNLAPFGIARSEPPMPTGTIGTPAFTAT